MYPRRTAAQPKEIVNIAGQHWGVENKLHWVLDTAFGDGHSRIRKDKALRNMAIFKKTVLNFLSIVKKASPRLSFKRMRKMTGWDFFLEKVLSAEF